MLTNQQYDGILTYYQNAPRIERNTVTTTSAYNSFEAIHLGYCDNQTKVLRNKVDIPNGTGLRVYRCDGVSANRVLVANNFIHVGGSVTAYGIYSDYGFYQNFYFNNVHLSNSSAASRTMLAYPWGNYNFLNNVFANSGGGFAAYVSGGSGVASSNFNDLFATGVILGYWDGTNAADIAAWRTASGKDANSVSANPLFYSDADLHVLQVALDSAATPVSGIGTDFDGETRSAGQPDIGADEFDYLTDDLGITQLIEPEEDCNLGMATVKVLIQNFGGLPQTGFDVAYRLNGGAQVSENVGALSVPPGGTAMYVFATQANLSAYVEHDFELYTLLAGDLNLPNDTLETSVQNFQTPAVPGNMLPSNGTINVDPPVNFSWLPSAGATRYDLYVWKNGDPEPGTPSVSDITQISYAYNISDWVYGAVYNWKLVAKNNYCGTPSGAQSFTLRELPDLITQNVQPPSMPFSGQSIEVTWEVHNMGLGSTGMTTWYDYVYLSADNVFQAGIDDYLGGFANFTALNGSGTYSNMKNVTLPNGIQGTYYLFVIADYGGNLLEGNNNNNVSPAASMVVTLTPPPDLQVTAFITPSTAFSGTNINVSWTVSNEGPGNVPTGNNFYDHIYFSNEATYNAATATYVGSYYSAPIVSGASHQRTQQISIPNGIFGNHYVHVRTDIYNYVFEHAFESNNTGNSNAINIVLTPPPNLKVTCVTAPDPVENNQSISLLWTTANQGATAASGGFYERVYLSSSSTYVPGAATMLVDFYYGSTISAGSSVARSATVTVPGNVTGTQYFYVETDIYNNIYEYNLEGDNVSAAENTTVQNADLVVTGVSLADTVQSGTDVSVNWTVKNNGTGDVLGVGRTDRVYLSTSTTYNPATATHVGTLTYNNSLAVGDSILRQATVTIPNGISGVRYMHVVTDYGNNVFENTGENNNTNYQQTQVLLAPWADLRVDTLTGLPDTTIAGTVLNLSFIVKNYGLGAVQGVSGGWKDRVYISANPVWNINTAVLLKTIDQLLPVAPGANYSGSTSFVLPMLGGGAQTGVCYIYVFTDATDKIYEYTDEGNNTKRSHPLYVSAPDPVDFEALTTTTLADTLDSGETVNLQWSVRNNGNPTTLWSYALWYDGVYLSVDSVYDEYDDLFVKDFTKKGPLVTDEVYSKNENFQIPNGISGDYFAFLVSDHTELTNDGDEDNNWRRIRPASFPTGAAMPIHIELSPSPDLEANTVVAPTSGISGQPIQVIWTVTNEGDGTTSGSWTDKFYLSTDFDISNNDPIVGSKSQTRTLTTGQFYQDTMEVFIPITSSGNFVLIFKTDANNALFEFDGEDNNEFFTYLTASLPLPSDLVVNSIGFGGMAMVGEDFSVTYNLKNQGTNPATGTMRDIVYFSADSVFDAMDVPYLGPFNRSINLAPSGNLSETFTGTTPGVPLGDYFIITQTDALNNIYESSETNNVTISTGKVTVSVQELPLGVLTPDTLVNEVNLFYRVEIDSVNDGETMRISLDGHTAQSVNELYVSFNEVPTRSDHDFSFPNPFTSDQAITIPEVQIGQYYLLAYGSTLAGSEQDVDLKAEIIPFQISDVDAEEGGNTGNVTLRIDGAKFTADMELRLFDATLGEVVAHTLIYVNSTRVFATFNLAGEALGVYDVVAEKSSPAATTSLVDGFEIVAGGAGTTTSGAGGGGFFCNIVNVGTDQNLQKNIAHPVSIRVNRVAPITIQFGNDGDVDIPCPTRWLISLRGAPIAFTVDGLEEGKQELFLNFMELGGPPGILRPGAYSSITVYAYSSHPMRFVLRE